MTGLVLLGLHGSEYKDVFFCGCDAVYVDDYIFFFEDGGSSILQYVHTHSRHDTASHSTIMYSTFIKDDYVYVSKIQDSLRGLIERIVMQNQSRNSPGQL